jgi:hypothetical protein
MAHLIDNQQKYGELYDFTHGTDFENTIKNELGFTKVEKTRYFTPISRATRASRCLR